jgi:hypothetical protein
MRRVISTSRRDFLGIAGGAVVLPVAGSLLLGRAANAAASAHLDESDPTAAALGYRKDTTQVDAARYPQHKPTQICADCRYFQSKGDAEWAPCSIFAGKGAVHAKGWCAAFAAR